MMGICKVCNKKSELISSCLSLCYDCILKEDEPEKMLDIHKKSRKEFGLPEEIPRDRNGLQCNGCGNECAIGGNELGFCGLVKNKNQKLIRLAGDVERGLCEWYYDPHVTNCVAAWVCPAGTGCGYPKYAKKDGAEYGYKNLAVFYGACNFNCLFCQNWHYKNNTKNLSPLISAEDLASKVDAQVSCICYFGGDPGPQLMHAIKSSELAVEKNVRICMETNGNANPALLKRFADIALKSGGIIKFDIKTFDENLNLALCGISNKKSLENFQSLIKYHKKRPEVPFFHVSTLLVPGYVEEEQVRKISNFIAELDPSIPYSLLAFYPQFYMDDLPTTSKAVAYRCLEIAKQQGLERVRIGNIRLLR